MILLLASYLGGVLTILSPCILPVLPFVFARADRPFLANGLPMLIGMTIMFVFVATIAAVGGGWAVAANEYGRVAALVLIALFGLTLIFPEISERLTRPLVALGDRLSQNSVSDNNTQSGFTSSLVLGFATGLLWAPCAGPILGLILAGAAIKGASIQTSLLLLAYAAGAATSLALALLVGGRLFTAMKRSLAAGEILRKGIGVAVVTAAVAIAFGFDTGALTKVSSATTSSIEQKVLDFLQPKNSVAEPDKATGDALAIEGKMPSLDGATAWLNSPALSPDALKGKVVLVDFWTYSCINCLRTIPYVRAWAEKYKDKGLVVIGVHTPEFAFEKNVDNVKAAIGDLKINYPVATDNNFAIWRAFNNKYWPAHYLVDANGNIRNHHYGEGNYAETERVIQKLLAEAGKPVASQDTVKVASSGAQAAPMLNAVASPETYVGYARAQNFVSPGGAVKDTAADYAGSPADLNQWALNGNWTVLGERAVLNAAGGKIAYRFHARDLHLVLGPASDSKPVRFKVTIDGAAPGANHGSDTDADGDGVMKEHRLYQLVRQTGPIADHTFEIEFLDPGMEAFAFTFG